jgi:hypothetical protein
MTDHTRGNDGPSNDASWTPSDADRLYAVTKWGRGAFRVTEGGHLAVEPTGAGSPGIDMFELRDRCALPRPLAAGVSALPLPTPTALRPGWEEARQIAVSRCNVVGDSLRATKSPSSVVIRRCSSRPPGSCCFHRPALRDLEVRIG